MCVWSMTSSGSIAHLRKSLGFVARRLVAESVGMVFAVRIPSGELAGLAELRIEGLQEADAQALLDSVLTGPLDTRVRDQILAETHGNPLALLELPRGLIPQQLAGRFRLPSAMRLSGGIEENFRRRVDVLPDQTRRLLLIAAAQPVGDPAVVWGAAARLGIGAEATAPATEAGLIEFGMRVRFRHPLVRSVVYGSALPQERQQVHRALADVTDPEQDPDRHAWHRAHAAAGPDEAVAAELERCADRAQARGGVAAAAAFLEHATMLTLDTARRTERALGAASAKIKAGAFGAASELLSIAEAGPPDDFQQARIDLVRAELSFVTNWGSDAPSLLLKAASRLEPIDVDLSRATYLQALAAGMFAGEMALGGGVLEVARAAVAAPAPAQPRAHPISFWTASQRTSTGDIRPDCRCCGGHWTSSASACRSTRNFAGIGWPALSPGSYGMTVAGRCIPRDTSGLPVASARSASFRWPSMRARS